MTRSSFNRMIVSRAASIWEDLSHGVDCLRIGTATAAAAAACKGKPSLSVAIEVGKVGRACVRVCGGYLLYLT